MDRIWIPRTWIAVGSLYGLTAVAMEALAAHALSAMEAARVLMVRDAVQMQGWHALALLACGIMATPLSRWAGAAFALGVLLFCGDVYALAFADIHMSAVAPTGGFLLMGGWALLGLSALRGR